MINRNVLHRSLLTAVLTLPMVSSCTHNSNPVGYGGITGSSKILGVGSTLTFVLSMEDSGSFVGSQTYRVSVDSIHQSIDGKSDVSLWSNNNNGISQALISYGPDCIDVNASILLLPYSGTYGWVSFPFGYAGSAIETRRLDTTIFENGQYEEGKLRDTLQNLGTEYVRVGGMPLQCVHLRGTEFIQLSIVQSNMTQTEEVIADYWYAPSIGYFVVQDRRDTYRSMTEHLELLAYYPN
jgi:hypothetical protein